MPKASVTRHIARDKQTLIDFVLDIEKYPEFIPFCIDSKVYEKKEVKDCIKIIADLTIGKKPFTDTYKSDVMYDKNIPIAITAQQSLEKLTSSRSLEQPFKRTISRLYELTSKNF